MLLENTSNFLLDFQIYYTANRFNCFFLLHFHTFINILHLQSFKKVQIFCAIDKAKTLKLEEEKWCTGMFTGQSFQHAGGCKKYSLQYLSTISA